jgi:hypothetical protein
MRGLSLFILRISAVLVVAAGVLHLLMTGHLMRWFRTMTVAHADVAQAAMLLNHLVMGILLLPLGVTLGVIGRPLGKAEPWGGRGRRRVQPRTAGATRRCGAHNSEGHARRACFCCSSDHAGDRLGRGRRIGHASVVERPRTATARHGPMTVDEFIALVLQNRFNRAIFARLPGLELPDAWLVSGALFQTVWNVLSGYPAEYGIKDYDIFYFDRDTTWTSEDAVIRRVATAFENIGERTEVRNQARVHLWYEEKFGLPYPQLSKSTDGIDRFLHRNAQVGIRARDGGFEVYAPQGLDDIAQMRIRPNPTSNFQTRHYEEKARRWKTLWPRLTVEPA